MDRIFISYRRDDSAATCGRIYDRLGARFGKENVFKDVESIPLGVNFEQYIGDVVSQCAVQLVVIGPTWLTSTNEDGQRRLDDLSDMVRIEIEAALRRSIPVIPVLVQGASIPRASQLPESLQELVNRNGIPVRYDPDFEPDMVRLIAALESWVTARGQAAPATTPTPSPTPTPAAPWSNPNLANPGAFAAPSRPLIGQTPQLAGWQGQMTPVSPVSTSAGMPPMPDAGMAAGIAPGQPNMMAPMPPPAVHPVGTPGAPAQPWGAPPPQPPKRNTGLIIGIVAAVLVVVCVISVIAIAIANNPGPSTVTTPTATATAAPKVVYQSLLNSAEAVQGWRPIPAGSNDCTYDSAGLHLNDQSEVAYCLAPSDADITDGTISVQMREVTASSPGGYFGIAFRAGSANTSFTGYTFAIDDSANWCFQKTPKAGDTSPVSGCNGTASTAIQTGQGATNTLVVTMSGSHFTFSLNGKVVTQADDSDISSQSVVGLFSDPGEEVVFTSFVVTQ
jgi:TIR domain